MSDIYWIQPRVFRAIREDGTPVLVRGSFQAGDIVELQDGYKAVVLYWLPSRAVKGEIILMGRKINHDEKLLKDTLVDLVASTRAEDLEEQSYDYAEGVFVLKYFERNERSFYESQYSWFMDVINAIPKTVDEKWGLRAVLKKTRFTHEQAQALREAPAFLAAGFFLQGQFYVMIGIPLGEGELENIKKVRGLIGGSNADDRATTES